MDEAEQQARMQNFYKTVMQNVQEYGFHIQAVFGGKYPFAYTVGLSVAEGFPEMIVVGLDIEDCGRTIEGLVKRAREVKGLPVGEKISGISSLTYILKPAPAESLANMGIAWRFREANDAFETTALQAFWSDENGVFEWEEGFNQQYTGYQSL